MHYHVSDALLIELYRIETEYADIVTRLARLF